MPLAVATAFHDAPPPARPTIAWSEVPLPAMASGVTPTAPLAPTDTLDDAFAPKDAPADALTDALAPNDAPTPAPPLADIPRSVSLPIWLICTLATARSGTPSGEKKSTDSVMPWICPRHGDVPGLGLVGPAELHQSFGGVADVVARQGRVELQVERQRRLVARDLRRAALGAGLRLALIDQRRRVGERKRLGVEVGRNRKAARLIRQRHG